MNGHREPSKSPYDGNWWTQQKNKKSKQWQLKCSTMMRRRRLGKCSRWPICHLKFAASSRWFLTLNRFPRFYLLPTQKFDHNQALCVERRVVVATKSHRMTSIENIQISPSPQISLMTSSDEQANAIILMIFKEFQFIVFIPRRIQCDSATWPDFLEHFLPSPPLLSCEYFVREGFCNDPWPSRIYRLTISLNLSTGAASSWDIDVC